MALLGGFMRILTFSTLFPNGQDPAHGIFVENRLRHLIKDTYVTSVVVAPVPFFPFSHSIFGRYADYKGVPHREMRDGIEVYHPRYLVVPKVGMTLGPRSLFVSCKSLVAELMASHGPFDLIDAHYFYPDGVAAAMLAQAFDLPLVITSRGTDINLIPEYTRPRQQILEAATQAAHLITVCEALRTRLVELGVSADKVSTLRNGVDLDLFHVHGREDARAQLSLTGPTLLSVGHLVERKGHHLVIEALGQLPDCQLVIVGAGPERDALERLAMRLGFSGRVRFEGPVPHDRLQSYYVAADVLVLASSREGWPNVLLESMASGTPVVATDVWGSGEVVASSAAGLLAPSRTVQSLTKSIRTLLSHPPDRKDTRRYAEGFSWAETSKGQSDLFGRIVSPSADETSPRA